MKFSRISGLEWDPNRGISIVHPLQVTLEILFLVLIGVWLQYVLVGCDRDWVILGAIFIEICGALGLAMLDVPSMASICYAKKLEHLHFEFSRGNGPKLDKQAEEILADVFLPSTSSTKDLEFRTEGEDWFDKQLVISFPDKTADEIDFNIARNELRRTSSIEEDRVRRTGAYLLISGFSLQFLGLLFDSVLPLRLIQYAFELASITLTSC